MELPLAEITRNRKKAENVAAVTHDGGKTWTSSSKPPQGYRSAVAVAASHTLVAVGTSGADVSHDGGNTWISDVQ